MTAPTPSLTTSCCPYLTTGCPCSTSDWLAGAHWPLVCLNRTNFSESTPAVRGKFLYSIELFGLTSYSRCSTQLFGLTRYSLCSMHCIPLAIILIKKFITKPPNNLFCAFACPRQAHQLMDKPDKRVMCSLYKVV